MGERYRITKSDALNKRDLVVRVRVDQTPGELREGKTMTLTEELRHDTSIRAVIPLSTGGRLIMAGFPGLRIAPDGALYIDPEAQELTLSTMTDMGVRRLFVLPEMAELPEGMLSGLLAVATDGGLNPIAMPIVDFSFPDEAFVRDWNRMRPELDAILTADHAVAFCCQYGAGRSGLLAANVMIERGLEAQDAIACVRSHFGEAIESESQVGWLSDRSRSLRETPR